MLFALSLYGNKQCTALTVGNDTGVTSLMTCCGVVRVSRKCDRPSPDHHPLPPSLPVTHTQFPCTPPPPPCRPCLLQIVRTDESPYFLELPYTPKGCVVRMLFAATMSFPLQKCFQDDQPTIGCCLVRWSRRGHCELWLIISGDVGLR